MKENYMFLTRNWKEIVNFDTFELEVVIDEYISNQLKSEKASIFYEWLLIVTYSFYKKRNFLKDKYKLYSSDELFLNIYTTDKKDKYITITEGMVFFLENYIDNRFFNIPLTLRNNIDELREEIENTTSKKKLTLIQEDLNKNLEELESRYELAQGLKSLLVYSKGNIKLFTSLIFKSMSQFSINIPTDNITLDREYKKAKNIITGKAENKSVKKANQNALTFYNVEFKYHEKNEYEQPFFSMKMNIDNKTEYGFDLALELASKVELKPFNPLEEDNEWKPTNSYILVAVLKQILIGYGGQCYMYEMKKILSHLLENVKKENPEYYEISTSEDHHFIQFGESEFSISPNQFSENAFKERKYYDLKIENFISNYVNEDNPSQKKYLENLNALERYFKTLISIILEKDNIEKIELSIINEKVLKKQHKGEKIHLEFIEFINSLKKPKIINFEIQHTISKALLIIENYKLRTQF